VLANPVGAVHDLAQLLVRGVRGGVLALAVYAPTDVGRGGSASAAAASACEEREDGTLGAADAGEPGFEESEAGRVEGGGIWNGMFLPGPRAGLEREGGEVKKLGQLEEGGAPDARVVGEGLGEVPGGAGHDEEVVVGHVAGPDLGVVLL